MNDDVLSSEGVYLANGEPSPTTTDQRWRATFLNLKFEIEIERVMKLRPGIRM